MIRVLTTSVSSSAIGSARVNKTLSPSLPRLLTKTFLLTPGLPWSCHRILTSSGSSLKPCTFPSRRLFPIAMQAFSWVPLLVWIVTDQEVSEMILYGGGLEAVNYYLTWWLWLFSFFFFFPLTLNHVAILQSTWMPNLSLETLFLTLTLSVQWILSYQSI